MSKEDKKIWHDPTGSSPTAVMWQRNEEGEESIHMLTNLGWVGPVEVELEPGETLQQAAAEIAAGYELEEVPRCPDCGELYAARGHMECPTPGGDPS